MSSDDSWDAARWRALPRLMVERLPFLAGPVALYLQKEEQRIESVELYWEFFGFTYTVALQALVGAPERAGGRERLLRDVVAFADEILAVDGALWDDVFVSELAASTAGKELAAKLGGRVAAEMDNWLPEHTANDTEFFDLYRVRQALLPLLAGIEPWQLPGLTYPSYDYSWETFAEAQSDPNACLLIAKHPRKVCAARLPNIRFGEGGVEAVLKLIRHGVTHGYYSIPIGERVEGAGVPAETIGPLWVDPSIAELRPQIASLLGVDDLDAKS